LAADIPDARLENNKGDVTIGLQMHQAGAGVVCFAPKKEHVKWSNHARRGVTTVHPAER
jgi:enhancing lycopene biosynthesis protein 2